MKARVKIVGADSKSSSMILNGLPTDMATPAASLLSFVSSIQPLFNGLLSEYYVLTEESQVLSIPALDVEMKSSLYKALITCGFTRDEETHYRGIWLPAPHGDRFNLVSGEGYRLDATDAATFMAALNTVSDTTHTYRQGVIEYREGKQARPNEGGFLVMQDIHGRPAFFKVPDVTDLTKLAAFAAVLGDATTPFTTAAISEAVIITPEGGVRTGAPTEEKFHDSVDGRCTMRFSWADGDQQRYMTLNAPTLKSTAKETPTGAKAKKVRVTEAAGDAIATALTTLYTDTVRDLTFEGGWADWVNLG